LIQQPYGWRAKLGLIYIASAYAMEVEFEQMAPVGVTTHTTRVSLGDRPERFTIDDLTNLKEDALHATKLLAQAPLQAIAFGCTSGSFVQGRSGDQQFIKEMEQIAQIPCTTTADAVVHACKALQVEKIALASPYSLEVNELALKYFQEAKIEIVHMAGLNMMNDYAISELSLRDMYELAQKAYDENAQALFISCTGLATMPLIEKLEEDLQIPVITSNQATLWYTLRLAGVNAQQKTYGTLFQTSTAEII